MNLAVIESIIPQQSFIELIGNSLFEIDGKVKIQTNNGIATIYSNSYVMDNPESVNLFGGHLDLLLMSIWDKSENKSKLWGKVFEIVKPIYEELSGNEMKPVHKLAYELYQRRIVFSIFEKGLRGGTDTMASILGNEMIRKNGLQDAQGIMTLLRKDFDSLKSYFDSQKLRSLFGRNDFIIIQPIWSMPGKLVGFRSLKTGEVIGFKNGEPVDGLSGDPRYLNLASEIKIAEDISRFPEASTIFLESIKPNVYFTSCRLVDWRSSIQQVNKLKRFIIPDLKVTTKRGEENLLEAVWGDYLEDPVNKENLLFQIGKEHRDVILQRLRDNELIEPYQRLKSAIPDKVIYHSQKYKLTLKPTGFHAESIDGTEIKQITNFIAEVKNVVSFKESNDTFINMNVSNIANLEGTEISIPFQSCNSVDKFQNAIHSDWLSKTDEGKGIPQIHERGTLGKIFLSWLQNEINSVPQILGVSRLGWSDDRTRFSSPFFEITEKQGVKPSSRKLHPQHKVFSYYSSKPYTIGPVTNKIPLELADTISQIVAMICRYKTGYTVKPIGVLNCGSSQRTLHKLFQKLGQTSPIILNSNQRQGIELPGIGGYPIYGSGYNENQLRSSNIPGFILMDSGHFPIGRDLTDEEIDIASSLLPSVISKVVHYLILNGNQEYDRVRSLVYEHELRMEGANIICKACGLLEWPVSTIPYINFETILRSIPYSETKEYFEYDLLNQTIRVYLSKVNAKFDSSDLLVELSSLMKHVSVKDSYIELDAPSAGTIFSDFYQNQIEYSYTTEEEAKITS